MCFTLADFTEWNSAVGKRYYCLCVSASCLPGCWNWGGWACLWRVSKSLRLCCSLFSSHRSPPSSLPVTLTWPSVETSTWMTSAGPFPCILSVGFCLKALQPPALMEQERCWGSGVRFQFTFGSGLSLLGGCFTALPNMVFWYRLHFKTLMKL